MSSNSTFSVLILFFSLSLLMILDSVALTSLNSCPSKCGEIEIPYPFGIEKGCYLDKGYEIECKNVSRKQVPFLSISSKEVVNISFPLQNTDDGSMLDGSLLIKSPITSSDDEPLLNLTGKENSQWLHSKQYATIELEWSFRTTNLSYITSLGCQNSLYIENSSCQCKNKTDSGIIYANCGCTYGYKGNPYLLGDCKDIDECQETYLGHPKYCQRKPCVNTPGDYYCKDNFNIRDITLSGVLIIGAGVLMLIGVGVYLYICIRRRKRINRKKNFFKRNGGLLLQQQLTSTQGNVETTKVFSSKELVKATENFCEKSVIGQGGQGTVYKGMLIDGKIVAVKKSKVVDEDKVEEF